MNIDDDLVFRLEGISLKRNGKTLLSGIGWEVRKGQNWAVTGPNGSGKSLLVQYIQGKIPGSGGNILFGDNEIRHGISSVSFEMHQQIMVNEKRLSYSRDFSGSDEEGTTVISLLSEAREGSGSIPDLDELVGITGIRPILNTPVTHLSNGEMRKFLITRALLKPHRVLILDEPYDGLDVESRSIMTDFFRRLAHLDTTIILVTHHIDEISDNISHVICLEKGGISLSGERRAVMAKLKDNADSICSSVRSEVQYPASLVKKNPDSVPGPVIEMKDVSICYGDKKIIKNFNWTVMPNENWAISGPNGAGKTTLLRLISGDHLQAYSNNIRLFGKKRGDGDSIWEIKARQGFLSPEFQNRYRKNVSAMDVVLSGFFDSVGLYKNAGSEQKKLAGQWLECLGLADSAEKNFHLLSYGEKRMILLARALVKSPEMLILDEPCQGLDESNRHKLISTVSDVSKSTGIQIIYVTHRRTELPDCMTNILEFRRNDDLGIYEYFLDSIKDTSNNCLSGKG